MLFKTYTILQQRTPALNAKLPMQECPAPVVRLMDLDVLLALGDGETALGNLRCYAEWSTGEFLSSNQPSVTQSNSTHHPTHPLNTYTRSGDKTHLTVLTMTNTRPRLIRILQIDLIPNLLTITSTGELHGCDAAR